MIAVPTLTLLSMLYWFSAIMNGVDVDITEANGVTTVYFH